MLTLLLILVIGLSLWIVLLDRLLVYFRLVLLAILLIKVINRRIIIKIITLIIIKMIYISILGLNIPLISIFRKLEIISLLCVKYFLSWKILMIIHIFTNRIKLSFFIILVFKVRFSIISIVLISLLFIL